VCVCVRSVANIFNTRKLQVVTTKRIVWIQV
jgi:hypothetical protein